MQFPDPWLSEILKPLSDAIVANFSVKVVLLLTVLAQSCIRWRFWRVRSSSPGSKIILGAFPRIIQCRWKRKSQLWQRKKIHQIKDRIFSSPWIFFHPLVALPVSPLKAAWNLYMIWLSPVLTASEAISAQIRAERDTYPTGYYDFVSWRALLSNKRNLSLLAGSCMGKNFMRTQIDQNLHWEGQAPLSATREDLNLKVRRGVRKTGQ